MKKGASKIQNRRTINSLPVVRNFQKIIENRDIRHMTKELYQFFCLNCGFIAHFDIDGFKATYGYPKSFSEIFIRQFDRSHPYFCEIYEWHHKPYKDTGYTVAEIREEFIRIVDIHKYAIERWARLKQKTERQAVYLRLKQEFAHEERGISVNCDACASKYIVMVELEGQAYSDFRIICCMFCGRQIKLQGGESNVEYTKQGKAFQDTEAL